MTSEMEIEIYVRSIMVMTRMNKCSDLEPEGMNVADVTIGRASPALAITCNWFR
jgi:hypothetical protein